MGTNYKYLNVDLKNNRKLFKNIYIAAFYSFNKEKYKNVISEKKTGYCWTVFSREETFNEKD